MHSDRTPEQEERSYRRRRKAVSLCSLLGLIGVFLFITFTFGSRILTFASDPEGFRAWAQGQGILGRLALIGIQVLQVVVAIMPGEVVEIAAGFTFGAWEGLLLCLTGSVLGSIIIYGFTRRFGVKMVEAFISREKLDSLKFIHNSRKLELLIFFLFLIPGTPKDVITYFIGLTPMKLKTFLVLSTIARIPSVISSTMGGNAMGLQDYRLAIIVFAITVLVSSIGLLIYTRIVKKHNSKH